MDSSRSPAASIRSAPWHAPSKTPPCCSKFSRATIRWIPRQSIGLFRTTRSAASPAPRAAPPGNRARVLRRRARRRSRGGRPRRGRRLPVVGGDCPGNLAAARKIRRGHLLHHRALRGVEQPGAIRRRALWLPDRRAEGGGPTGSGAQGLRAGRDRAGLDGLDTALVTNTAGPGRKRSGPKSSGGSCSARTPSAPGTTTPITSRR